MRVCIEQVGERIWSHGEGHGDTSLSYLHDGTQSRIIEALEAALVEARGQLGRRLQVADVIPYVRRAAAKV